LTFLAVTDGSSQATLQLVANAELPNYAALAELTSGASLSARGQLVASAGKGQSVEIQVTSLEIVGLVEDPDHYPIQPKKHSMEFLRTVAHLRPRTNTFGAVARVRDCASKAIHDFFHQEGFCWVHTPIITSSDCEGAGAMFRVSSLDLANLPRSADGSIDFTQDFFGKEAFLTVSGQLALESYCLALSKVYSFGPTFRAENSNTSRHLAEFWMVEPEVAFADLTQDAELAERFLKFIVSTVLKERGDDLAFFDAHVAPGIVKRLESLANSPFERMTYTEAVAHLERRAKTQPFEYPVAWGMDLQSEHERYLTEQLLGRPVVVTNYPKDIKAFYMRLDEGERTVAAMDVLAPGIGEIIGGAQREDRLEVLDRRLAEMGLSKESYWWYRDLRRYGTVPHAGFGLGLERLLVYITGLSNVRDVIPFPRTPGNADF